jgi:ATP-dependent DNA ligase
LTVQKATRPKRSEGRTISPKRTKIVAGNKRSTAEADFDLPVTTSPMEAQSAEELPSGAGWQFEPKWDGFRCLAFKRGDDVDLRAKSGKPLGRFFPEVVAQLGDLRAERFVIDGELVIEIEERHRLRRYSYASIRRRAECASSLSKRPR